MQKSPPYFALFLMFTYVMLSFVALRWIEFNYNTDGDVVVFPARRFDLAAISSISESIEAAYWKFDEDSGESTNDETGKNFPAVLSGVTRVLDGKSGSAFYFDGNNDYITLTQNTLPNPIDSLTISVWFRAATFGEYRTFVAQGENEYWWFGTYHNEFIFGGNRLSQEHKTIGLNIQPGEWHYASLVYDDPTDKVEFFLDGLKIYSAPETKVLPQTDATFFIGRSRYGEYWHGNLDELRIYNWALSPSEIAQDFMFDSRDAVEPVVGVEEKTPIIANEIKASADDSKDSIGSKSTNQNAPIQPTKQEEFIRVIQSKLRDLRLQLIQLQLRDLQLQLQLSR